MNQQRFTQKAQDALRVAQQLAEQRRHATLDSDHVLYALVAQEGGVVPRVLERLNVDVPGTRAALEQGLSTLATLQYSAQPSVRGDADRVNHTCNCDLSPSVMQRKSAKQHPPHYRIPRNIGTSLYLRPCNSSKLARYACHSFRRLCWR